ncbi:MAG: zinc ribbon domain-containing protein [Bacillota bacterium]
MHLPAEKRTKRLTPKERPESEWVAVPVPPVIEPDLYERAQAILENMKRRSSTRISPGCRGHLLSGVLTCGLCGGPIHYVWNNKINGYLLRCANKYPLVRGLKGPPPACSLVHLKAELIEAAVGQKIRSWFIDPNLLEKDLEHQKEQPTVDQAEVERKLLALNEQIDEAKTRQSWVLYLVSKGVVHAEVAEAQQGEIKRHLDALESERGVIQQKTRRSSHTVESIKRRVSMVRDRQTEVLKEIDRMTPEQKQVFVRMMVREARINGRDQVETIPVG